MSDAPGDIRACRRAANMAAPGAVVAHCVGIAGGGLSARWLCGNAIFAVHRAISLRNQTLISPVECSRSKARMDPTDQTPGRAPAQARTVRIPEDRDGQRLDNFLLGLAQGRAAQPDLQDRAQRPGAHQRQARQGRSAARGRGRDPHPAGPAGRTGATRARPPKGLLEALDASIVFEDARLLALNKPSGRGQPRRQRHQLRRDRNAARAAPAASRWSSCIASTATPPACWCVAKKRSALTELQALMREERAASPSDTWRCWSARMPKGTMTRRRAAAHRLRQGGERMCRSNPAGKPSMSHFKLLERRGGQSICEVRIETGRTHQIRVHAQHIGHPVAGDDKYGDRGGQQAPARTGRAEAAVPARRGDGVRARWRAGAVFAQCAAGRRAERRPRPPRLKRQPARRSAFAAQMKSFSLRPPTSCVE